MSLKGSLYLLPIPIYIEGEEQIPVSTIEKTKSINHFIVERAKTARAYLKQIKHPTVLQEIEILEIPRKDSGEEIKEFLIEKISQGNDVGVMSEAGCPGIADPGAEVVSIAHLKGIKVVPMVGPSSIFLALMASGFNGQEFKFHGYLSNKKDQLINQLRNIEREVNKKGSSHIFIEAPYRNQFFLETAVAMLSKHTELSMSVDINSPREENIKLNIEKWKKMDFSQFHKRPAIFILGKSNY